MNELNHGHKPNESCLTGCKHCINVQKEDMDMPCVVCIKLYPKGCTYCYCKPKEELK